jgi:hypothetical protein
MLAGFGVILRTCQMELVTVEYSFPLPPIQIIDMSELNYIPIWWDVNI